MCAGVIWKKSIKGFRDGLHSSRWHMMAKQSQPPVWVTDGLHSNRWHMMAKQSGPPVWVRNEVNFRTPYWVGLPFLRECDTWQECCKGLKRYGPDQKCLGLNTFCLKIEVMVEVQGHGPAKDTCRPLEDWVGVMTGIHGTQSSGRSGVDKICDRWTNGQRVGRKTFLGHLHWGDGRPDNNKNTDTQALPLFATVITALISTFLILRDLHGFS